jgi:ATP-dependent Clp protease ATP-binding subunit ClpA
MQLETQLADRNVTIELSDAARSWLAKKGYDAAFGARPLARIIQEHVKKPLAEELLFGRLAKGGVVRVDVAEDGKAMTFSYPEEEDGKSGGKPGGGKKGKKGNKGGGGKKVPETVE